MKVKLIKDKTLNTFVDLIWDCSEEEFLHYISKKTKNNLQVSGSDGKFYYKQDGNQVVTVIWVKRDNDLETLSHEILHLIRFWLQDFYEISLNKDTEEIYAMLHSFYFRQSLILFKLERYSS